jgi:hypothetical protein
MIDIKLWASLAATVLVMISYIPYIRDMLKGITKPHAYTSLVWTITQGTASAALLYGGAGIGSLSLAVGTVLVFVTFLLSLWYGSKNITRGDSIVLGSALIAVVVWWQLDQPLLSVIMVTAIDAWAYIPSWRKSYEEPWSETLSSWYIFLVAGFLSIIALQEYNLLTLTYIVVYNIANITLVAICLYRRRVIPKPL